MHSTFPLRRLAWLPLLLAAVHAHAQDAPAARLEFRSALQDYQPFSEEKQVPWKQANEAVREAGGWREYAKEAAAPPEAPTPSQEGRPSDPHGAHHAPAPKAKP